MIVIHEISGLHRPPDVEGARPEGQLQDAEAAAISEALQGRRRAFAERRAYRHGAPQTLQKAAALS